MGNTFGDISKVLQPAELTSWFPPEPEPPKLKGMPSSQKKRLGMYMEEFRSKNGGCLLTEGARIAEYSAYPEPGADAVRIYLYGLSTSQARKYNSDELAEVELFKRAQNSPEVAPDKAKVVIITLGKDSETRKYV